MGQRLVVNIVSNEQILACGYFHWSAYTGSAAGITQFLVKNMISTDLKSERLVLFTENATNTEVINKLKAYLLLDSIGAGIYHADSDNDIEEFQKMGVCYNYRLGEDRSDGLIALTPSKIKDFNYWAEGTVNIDISNDNVYFDVFARYEPDEVEEINKYNESNGIGKYEIKEIDFSDITRFKFEEVDTWYDKIEEMCNDNGYPFFKDKADDTVYYQVIA